MDKWSYTILNVVFFLPIIVLLFIFYKNLILKKWKFILLSGILGSIWFFIVDPPAVIWKAWVYDYTKILNLKFVGGSLLEEFIWVVLVWMILAIVIEIYFYRKNKQTITIIIGLPGSGKTTYINNNYSNLKNTIICDDYHKSTPSNSHNFIDSLYYNDLRKALSNNKDIVLSDIAWCKKDRRDLLLSEIDKTTKELKINPKIEFIYFENNPTASKNNVIKRANNDWMKRELEFIDKYSNDYNIPDNSVIIKIVN